MAEPHPQHITTEPVTQRVRVTVDGVEVADTTAAIALREGSLPVRYYIPLDDVRQDLLLPSSKASHCPFKGDATYSSIGDEADFAWTYPDPLPEREDITGLVAFFNERAEITVDAE